MLINYVNIWGRILIIPVLFFSLILVYDSAESNKENNALQKQDESDSLRDSHSPKFEITPLAYRKNVIDTVYTLKNSIVEVSLKDQAAYIRQRSGKVDTILCSTGTPFLEKGQDTKPGIFIVRSKMKELISKQFNDTKCLNWVGFSYGIGFHALISKKYYWSLGKRPSSHGCIRVSQEGSEILYDLVELGTPVIVHKNEKARTVEFLPSGFESDTTYSKKEVTNILKNRLKNLYEGHYFYNSNPVILVNEKYVGHDGYEVGEKENVPENQEVFINYYKEISFRAYPDKTFQNYTFSPPKSLTETDSTTSKGN